MMDAVKNEISFEYELEPVARARRVAGPAITHLEIAVGLGNGDPFEPGLAGIKNGITTSRPPIVSDKADQSEA